MTARYFSLAALSEIAYEFGLEDALEEKPPCPETLFPTDIPANAAYWAGMSLYYTLTGTRLFTCAYANLSEEITYYD